jgi:tRNA A-37 threonylcarbamoyl transferase component Bud32
VAGEVDDADAAARAATHASGDTDPHAATQTPLDTVASGTFPATRDGVRDLPEIPDARYTIAGEVGRGGIGRVVSARDAVLDRPVALKELFATDDSSRRRFIREAMITARLQHPAIIPIYEAGRRGDRSPFYAMKLVVGKPLDVAIKAAGSLAARLALVPTVLAVADAVAYAHSQRIIHRDLKPANVLVGEFGETVVIDWGLAKDLSIEDRDALDAGPYRATLSTHTVAGAVLGTPGYMAPEQAAGQEVDERADVYALGAILYHVVSGSIPHEGSTLDEVIEHAIRAEVKPLAEREPEAPPDLVALVDKAMAKAPDERYRTARELADDLRRFQTGKLVGAHRYTLAQRVRRWIRQHRAASTVAAVAAALCIAFGTWSIRQIIAERDRADRERDEAVDNANDAILTQARVQLARDPASALAWLARLSAGGSGWAAARTIAADALSRPLPDVLLRGSMYAHATPDGRHAVGFGVAGIWISELVPGAQPVHLNVALSGDPIYEVCDDNRRAVMWTNQGDDAADIVSIDLVAKRLDRRNYDEDSWEHELARCRAQFRLTRNAKRGRLPGLRWRDNTTGEYRLLGGVPGWQGAWLADDKQHVVGISHDGTFYRFDLASGGEEAIIEAFAIGDQANAPARAAMSRDGNVVVAALGGALTYCDLGAKMCLPVPGTAEDGARSIVVAPDGAWAVGRTKERGGWRVRRAMPIPGSAVLPRGDLYVTSDGKHVLGLFEGKLLAQNVASRTTHAVGGHDDIAIVQPLPDGRVFTVGKEGTVRVSSLAAASAQATTTFGNGNAAISPDTRWLVMDTLEPDLLRYEVATGKVEKVPGVPAQERAVLAVSDHGVVARAARDGAVHRLDSTGTWRQLGVHPGGRPSEIRVLDSGVVLTLNRTALAIWEPNGPRVIAVTAGAETWGGSPIQLDRREQRAHVACGEQRCVIELASGRVSALDGSLGRGLMSDDGSVLVSGGQNQQYLVWDLATLRVKQRLPAIDALHGVSGVSRDGRSIVLKGERGLELVDLATMRRTLLRSEKPIVVSWMLFSPDNRSILDSSATLWDAASGEGRRIAPGAEAFLTDIVDDKVVVVTLGSIDVVADDLPRDPALLSAHLRALPYQLDTDNTLVVQAKSRR